MVKNLIFDLGGVVIFLDPEKAERRFREVGIADAAKQLNIYGQGGAFGELEKGNISAEEFCRMLGLTHEQAFYAWMGYLDRVFQEGLDYIMELRSQYKTFILSNTNPILMDWGHSDDFAPAGHSLDWYFDKVYTSYELHDYKPAHSIFQKVLDAEGLKPEETLFIDDSPRNIAAAQELGMQTLLVENGKDWREKLRHSILQHRLQA